MWHHKDAVNGQARDAFGLEGVDEHGGRLHSTRGVRQNAAASDEEVEVAHFDEAFAACGLVECIGQGAFGLYAFETDGQCAVLDKGQAQGFAGNGLFDLKFFEHLRNCGGADHFVFDAIAQVGFIDVKWHPAHNIIQARFGEHVGYAVGHAEVGRYRAVEDILKDAEYVGGSTAYVNAHDIDILLFGYGLHHEANRAGRGHDGCPCPGDEFSIARCLRHDVFEKEVVDYVAGGTEVFCLERGADVFRDGEGCFVAQGAFNFRRGIFVSGVNDG